MTYVYAFNSTVLQALKKFSGYQVIPTTCVNWLNVGEDKPQTARVYRLIRTRGAIVNVYECRIFWPLGVMPFLFDDY